MYVAATNRFTYRGAKHMAAVAVERAQAAGIAIAVAVADAGGHLVVLERMDGGRFHTVHSATTKAVCAASNKRPTSARGAQAQPLDVVHALGLALAAGAERWTAMEGGYPVHKGTEGRADQDANTWRPRLLCSRQYRPSRRCAAEKRDEVAPSHGNANPTILRPGYRIGMDQSGGCKDAFCNPPRATRSVPGQKR